VFHFKNVFICYVCVFQVFDRLKKEQSSALSKIVLITGNVSEPGLGINPDDVAKLTNEVSVIIHNAATIRFTEPLKLVSTECKHANRTPTRSMSLH